MARENPETALPQDTFCATGLLEGWAAEIGQKVSAWQPAPAWELSSLSGRACSKAQGHTTWLLALSWKSFDPLQAHHPSGPHKCPSATQECNLGLAQSSSASAHQHSGLGHSCCGACSGPCGMLSSIPSLHPLDADSAPLPTVMSKCSWGTKFPG